MIADWLDLTLMATYARHIPGDTYHDWGTVVICNKEILPRNETTALRLLNDRSAVIQSMCPRYAFGYQPRPMKKKELRQFWKQNDTVARILWG